MDYLLDTNICIHYFKGQFEIKDRIQQIGYVFNSSDDWESSDE